MRISKWIKPLGFVIALCLVNGLLSFLIEPVRGSSGTMWKEYYQEESLDTVFVGSSFCVATFDPYVFDEELGVKSFNMGTPLQAIDQTISALETALEDHEIKNVIIGTGFFVFQEEAFDKAELTFEKAKARQMGGLKGIAEGARYMLKEGVRDTEKSINYLFPWLYNQEEVSVEFISQNVSKKIDAWHTPEVKETSKKGYRCFEGVVDYDTQWEINSYTYYDQSFDEELLEQFGKLLQLCKEQEVDVIVINSPHPTFDVVSCYETYAQSEAIVKELCQEYGADYYNFSLAKPELFDAKPEYFYDFEHLNDEGAKVFSRALCEFLEKRAAGQNVEEEFYTVEEYLTIHKTLLEDWKNSL
ncbi:MAG: SGNH/GDSL hydrolase family protein [Roseburia sp.]|nr:SGNH/GDSL hydrolase family protein [Roseburia sp.]